VADPLPILTDNCVPEEIVMYLRERGQRVTPSRHILSDRADDTVIVQYANTIGAIVVTFDKDYRRHADLAMRGDRSKHRFWGLVLLDYPKHFKERHLLPWIDDIEREYRICVPRHPDTMLLHVEVQPSRLIIHR
jgi:hypothetical protein